MWLLAGVAFPAEARRGVGEGSECHPLRLCHDFKTAHHDQHVRMFASRCQHGLIGRWHAFASIFRPSILFLVDHVLVEDRPTLCSDRVSFAINRGDIARTEEPDRCAVYDPIG